VEPVLENSPKIPWRVRTVRVRRERGFHNAKKIGDGHTRPSEQMADMAERRLARRLQTRAGAGGSQRNTSSIARAATPRAGCNLTGGACNSTTAPLRAIRYALTIPTAPDHRTSHRFARCGRIRSASDNQSAGQTVENGSPDGNSPGIRVTLVFTDFPVTTVFRSSTLNADCHPILTSD